MKRQILKSFLTLVLAMLAMGSYAQDTKEYVDLGLPSGTLWATCNVGASSPEQTGNYYAWGETTTKATYVQSNYRFGNEDAHNFSKYCTLAANGTVDRKTTLEAADDAATANWGSDWCMPTTAQLKELWSTCSRQEVTQKGVRCYKLTGKNGNYILMPRAGAMGVNGLQNEDMLICNSREMETGVEGRTDLYVYTLMPAYLDAQGYMTSIRRFIGVPVRAVCSHSSKLTVGAGDDLSAIKASLGTAVSYITQLYITGDYRNTASINALKTNFFPNLAKVHLTLQTSATSIDAWAYRDCTLLTSIIIPENVTSIGIWAFYDCTELTSVTLHDGVTFDYIFRCKKLAEVNVNLSGFDKFLVYKGRVSWSSLSISVKLYYNNREVTTYVVPSGVTSIGDYTFNNCSGLTSITLPESVNSIGEFAFRNCSSLTSITLPESVNSIGQYAFRNCSSLNSVTIPDGVTNICSASFRDCSRLTSIVIPDGVTNIGDYAFDGCTGLTEVNIGKSVETIGQNAFSYCNKINKMTLSSIPLYIRTIDWGLFWQGSLPTEISLNLSDDSYIYTGTEDNSEISNLISNIKSVTYNRSIVKDGGKYTFIVPFDIPAAKASELGKFYQYDTLNKEEGKVYFNDISIVSDGVVRANTAYIFDPAKDITSFTIENPTFAEVSSLASVEQDAVSHTAPGLYGTYSQIAVPEGAYGYNGEGVFVKAGTGNMLNPFRAYLWLGNNTSTKAQAIFGSGESDAIVLVESDSQSKHNTSVYNLRGQRVAAPQKGGIYIQNGKKIVIR